MSYYAIFVRGLFVMCLLYSINAFAKPNLRFFGSQGQSVEIPEYSFAIPTSTPLAIDLTFSQPEAKRLADLMQRSLGSQLTVTIGAQTTMTPVVRDTLKGSGIELTFSDAKSFAAVKAALAGTGSDARQ